MQHAKIIIQLCQNDAEINKYKCINLFVLFFEWFVHELSIGVKYIVYFSTIEVIVV